MGSSDISIKNRTRTTLNNDINSSPIKDSELLSSSAIAFRVKKASVASQANKADDNISEAGMRSVSSRDSSYRFNKKNMGSVGQVT